MQIDWSQVKTKTLWQYEELTKKIITVLNYGFIKEKYNHTMSDAANYAERIQQNYLQNGKAPGFIEEIKNSIKELEDHGIANYSDLMLQIETKELCEEFLKKTGYSFEALIHVLNYLFRWVLPFTCPIRELLSTISIGEDEYAKTLKNYCIRCNLDVLEKFRTTKNREKFSEETGMKEEFLLELAHRADMSRIAYVRGKTIKHLCGGGYDTLDKLANADFVEMKDKMTSYYSTLGKSFSDFRNVIPLDWMIGGAKILPRVVEA